MTTDSVVNLTFAQHFSDTDAEFPITVCLFGTAICSSLRLVLSRLLSRLYPGFTISDRLYMVSLSGYPYQHHTLKTPYYW
jgi:hypothetical protein